MPRILRFQIDASYDGRKVVHFLRGEAGLSARLVQSLKRLPDGICLNGAPTRTIDQLCEGDELTLRLPDDLNRVEPLELPLDIRYEDDDLLILNKPAGLAMHPTLSLIHIYPVACARWKPRCAAKRRTAGTPPQRALRRNRRMRPPR